MFARKCIVFGCMISFSYSFFCSSHFLSSSSSFIQFAHFYSFCISKDMYRIRTKSDTFEHPNLESILLSIYYCNYTFAIQSNAHKC